MVVEYAIVRSRRRRRTLALTLDEAGRATVAVPMATTRAEIQQFVARHGAWIIRRRAEIAAAPPPRLESGAALLFLGEPLTLHVEDTPTARARAALEGDRLQVEIPKGLVGEAREEIVRRVLRRWYRAQAASRLVDDAARWARAMDVQPRDVRVRDQRRRWGSCGADGTIRLSFRLVMAPQELVDYVVVHELAHLRVHNHSPAFWGEVARFLPDYAARRKRLNEFGRSVAI